MKSAIVTGAASGIGAACQKALADFGISVIPWDIDGEIPVDVTDAQSVAEAVKRLDGPIDAAILAAGVSRMAPLLETTDDDWHMQMNVNAYGVFNCLRALVPVINKGGAVAVIDSMAGLRGAPYLSAYCASKFAVSGLIESATPELAVRDIRINGICPMYVRTPMEERELEWEGQLRGMTPQQVFAEYESSTPLGRVAEPSEIAAIAAFLVSDASSYITGSLIPVSGGAHLGFTVERNKG
jgi:meso-butanediol dehydrogenase/(S,S)-butanediol dehydrogenase/diacetyl reductase